MTPDALFSELSGADRHVFLRRSSPGIAHLGHWLKLAFDKRGELAIEGVRRLATDDPEQLAFTGKARVCNARTRLKAVFDLKGGEVTGFYILCKPAKTWKLRSSFKTVDRKSQAGAFLSQMGFAMPSLVFAAGAGAITDGDLGLSEERFANGLSLFSPGLKDPLPVQDLGFGAFNSSWPITTDAPETVKMHLTTSGGNLIAEMQVWWPRNSGVADHVGGARVLRPGWSLTCAALETADPITDTAWMWELETQPGAAPMVVLSSLPAAPEQKPTYRAIFPAAVELQDGTGALASFTQARAAETDAAMPFGEDDADWPELAMTTLAMTPGSFFSAQLIALERGTGEPWEWNAIPGRLTIRGLSLALTVTQKPTVQATVAASGIADIGGYDFQIAGEVTPKGPHKLRSISGMLVSPHEVDVEAMVSTLFRHPVDLPNLQLKLLGASYLNDYDAEHLSMSLDVGGHIDLLGNGMLLLEQVGFSYVSLHGEPRTKELRGRIELAGLPISMAATYHADTGWTYSGQAQPSESLKLHDMLNDLLHRMQLAVPPFVPDVAISEIAASLNSKTRDLTFSGRAIWKPPDTLGLPWHVDEIDTLVDISSRVDARTAARSSEVSLQWLYAPTESFTALATAEFGQQGTAFYIDWDGTESGTTIGLSTLHEALSLDSVFPRPTIDGWSIFEFSRLSVTYQPNPREIQFETISKLGGGELALSMAFARDYQSIVGTWEAKPGETLGVGDLLSAAGLPSELSLPGDLSESLFSFSALTVQYLKDRHESVGFIGRSAGAARNDRFVSLYRGSAGWGFVAGIAFAEATKLTDLPGLGSIAGLDVVEKFVSIEPEFLLVSSVSIKSFVPPVSGVRTHALDTTLAGPDQRLAPAQRYAGARAAGYTLDAGATFAGRIILKGSSNPIYALINEIVGVDALDAAVTIGNGVEVLASIPEDIDIPIGDGTKLSLLNPHFGCGAGASGQPKLSVGGSATLALFGDVHHVDLDLVVTEASASALFHTIGVPIPPVHGLPGVHINEDFWVELGIHFEPPGFDMGLEGTFYIGDDPARNSGEGTVVMNLVEGVPTPEYIRFSITELTFWSMFEAMTGTLSRLENIEDGMAAVGERHGSGHGAVETLKQQYKNLEKVFDDVMLSHVAFHWADAPVTLPDGTTALPGVGFKGLLSLFGFDLYGAFDFATGTETHFTAHLEMEPVDIQHVISITGDGKGLRKSEVETETERRARKGAPLPAEQDTYVLQHGGPVFIVSTQHPPFLHASIHVRLFDVIHADLTADIDMHKMFFELSGGIGDLITYDLTCLLSYDGPPRVHAHGKLGVHIKADFSISRSPLPDFPINLDAGFDGEINLDVCEDGHFSLEVDGGFEFDHCGLSIPTLPLTEPLTSLDDLPQKLVDHIIEHKLTIFADLLTDPDTLIALGTGLADAGIDMTAKRIELATDTAAKAADLGLRAADAGIHAGDVAVLAATTELRKGIHAAEAEADRDLGQLADATRTTVTRLGRETQHAVAEAEDTFNTMTFGAMDKIPGLKHLASTLIGQGIGRAAEIAAGAINTCRRLEHEALEKATEILDKAQQAAEKIEEGAKKILQGLHIGLDWTKHAAEDAIGTAADTGKKAVNAVGDVGRKVGGGIKSGAEGLARGVKGLFS